MKKLFAALTFVIISLIGCTYGDQPPATDINEESSGRPTNIRAESTLQGINISWENSGSSNVLIYKSDSTFLINNRYQVKSDAELIFSGKGFSFLDQNTEANKFYYYLVIASSDSFPSFELKTTLYDVSRIENSSLIPSPVNSQIEINWIFPSDPNISGIEIYKTLTPSTSPTTEGSLIYASSDKTITSFLDQNLSLGTEYCYSFITIYSNEKKTNHQSCTTLNHLPISITNNPGSEITLSSPFYWNSSRSAEITVYYKGNFIPVAKSPYLGYLERYYVGMDFNRAYRTSIYTIKGHIIDIWGHPAFVISQPFTTFKTPPTSHTFSSISWTEEEILSSTTNTLYSPTVSRNYFFFMPGIQIIPGQKYNIKAITRDNYYRYLLNETFTVYEVTPID